MQHACSSGIISGCEFTVHTDDANDVPRCFGAHHLRSSLLQRESFFCSGGKRERERETGKRE
ncbi:hypothetical protein CRG98_050014, partial [Punica granatum]